MPAWRNKHFNKIAWQLTKNKKKKKTQQFRVVSLKLNFSITIFNQHCFVLLLILFFFCFFFLFFVKFGKYILHTFADQMNRPIIDSITLTSFTTSAHTNLPANPRSLPEGGFYKFPFYANHNGELRRRRRRLEFKLDSWRISNRLGPVVRKIDSATHWINPVCCKPLSSR